MEKTEMNIPELRFSEFEIKWGEYGFGEIYTFYMTNSFSRSLLNYKNGNVKNIHYGDIHTKFKTNFYINNENVPFINNDIDLSKIIDDSYCKKGDLIIADASEDYNDVGKSIELIDIDNQKLLSGLHTYIARDNNNKTALGFSGYLMQTHKVRLQKMKIATGISVLGISKGNLSKINISLPSLPEQQKIASFLTAVDKKIEKLNKKKELSEQYKKGIMQQIFSQQIRFKPDPSTGSESDYPDWEEKKLGDIALKKSSNISANTLEGNFGQFKIFGASGHLSSIDFYREEEEYIAIVKDGAGVGRNFICEGKSSVLGTLDILKNKDNVNLFFLYLILNQIVFNRYITGSTIPHIYFKDYSFEKIKLPCLKEQQKIASFLSSIDQRIDHINRQIEKAKEFKKGLLQKMFV